MYKCKCSPCVPTNVDQFYMYVLRPVCGCHLSNQQDIAKFIVKQVLAFDRYKPGWSQF